jgi:ABC-type microcin C transport system duplicated ATPase subunit YejF
VIRTEMLTKLAEAKQEQNTALLKVIEKEGAIERLSEQLQNKCRTLVLSSLFLRTRRNLSFVFQRPKSSWRSRRCLGSRMWSP